MCGHSTCLVLSNRTIGIVDDTSLPPTALTRSSEFHVEEGARASYRMSKQLLAEPELSTKSGLELLRGKNFQEGHPEFVPTRFDNKFYEKKMIFDVGPAVEDLVIPSGTKII